jgi:APA family basic amino acid/polyamine antiporter
VSAFGVLNAQFLTGPRLVWALSADGRFFRPFAGVHHTWRTPVPAILLLAGLSLVVVFAAGIAELTAWVVVVDALFFALTGLALVRFDVRDRGVGVATVAALAFAGLELAAVYGATVDPEVRDAAVAGFVWVGLAALSWAIWFRRPSPG